MSHTETNVYIIPNKPDLSNHSNTHHQLPFSYFPLDNHLAHLMHHRIQVFPIPSVTVSLISFYQLIFNLFH